MASYFPSHWITVHPFLTRWHYLRQCQQLFDLSSYAPCLQKFLTVHDAAKMRDRFERCNSRRNKTAWHRSVQTDTVPFTSRSYGPMYTIKQCLRLQGASSFRLYMKHTLCVWSTCIASAGLRAGKGNLALCAPWRHMCGMEVQLHSFLIPALDVGKWRASPWPLYLREVAGNIHLEAGLTPQPVWTRR